MHRQMARFLNEVLLNTKKKRLNLGVFLLK